MSLSTTSFMRQVLIVLMAIALPLTAANAQHSKTHYPSDRASRELGKLQPFIEAENWNEAINLLNDILLDSDPDSYDEALANDILAKILMQKGDYPKAITPMERAYQLGADYGYFRPKAQLEQLNYLSKLYYQEALDTKVSDTQKSFFSKAETYIEISLKQNPSPSQEERLFYVSMLYNQAVMDTGNVDQAKLKKAQEQAYEALNFELFPKENFYVLLLATLQQQGELKKTAEILELLVKQYPSKNNYWQQLLGTYSNMTAVVKTPDQVLESNLRAILTIERAQSLGFMNMPKDNYNLVGIYFNIGQYGIATKLLYDGLRNGAIEQDIKKWELLAYSFLQTNNEFKAIEVLKEATRNFSKAGQLDNQIAQIYYSLNQTKDAYHYLNVAIAKGNLDKPGAAYYFKAYLCYELLKFDEALEAANQAAKYEDSKNSQLPRLKQSIEDAIKDREYGNSVKTA